jgi:hypothetical protein
MHTKGLYFKVDVTSTEDPMYSALFHSWMEREVVFHSELNFPFLSKLLPIPPRTQKGWACF